MLWFAIDDGAEDEDDDDDGKMRPNTIPKVRIPIIPTNISRGESFVDDTNDVCEQHHDFRFPSRSFSSGLLLLVVLSLSLY